MRTRYIAYNEDMFRRERRVGNADEIVFEKEYTIKHAYFSAYEKIIQVEGFRIIYRDWHLDEAIVMETRHEQPFFKMQFELEGHSDFKSTLGNVSKDVLIPGGKHSLMFLPEVHGNLFYPRSRKSIDIVFHPPYIRKVFKDDLSIFDKFGQCIEKNQPALLGNISGEITPAMRIILNDIAHCHFEGLLKKVYLESKVIELLVMQIDYFNSKTEIQTDMKLRPEDIEKLHYIKQTITESPEDEYSMHRLSELAGINDFKLKKGFKSLFGNTVFGYINDLRMEKAKTLLMETGSSIVDISMRIGYKYPQHFTKAFKKKFGYLPKDLKH